MRDSEIIKKLESLLTQIQNRIATGTTDLQTCQEASKTCLNIVVALRTNNPNASNDAILEDLEERFGLIMSYYPTKLDDEDAADQYSRYCSLQVVNAAQKLIDNLPKTD